MQTVIYTIVVLGVLGLVGALVLYLTAKRFHVEEDERISRIEDLLPGANCGACGRNGCHDLHVRVLKKVLWKALCVPVHRQARWIRCRKFSVLRRLPTGSALWLCLSAMARVLFVRVCMSMTERNRALLWTLWG